MPDIALATFTEFPDLWMDDVPLAEALRDRGALVEPCVWDDPAVDWSRFDVVVVRSTWDYTERRDEFVAWAERVDAVTNLANPASVIRWNTEKTYLRTLADQGVPVIPTAWLDRPADLPALLRERAWAEAVLKPAVSAGARDTVRFTADTPGTAPDLLAKITESGLAMVQPYCESVEDYGERSLLFVDGELSHAVRRQPALAHGQVFSPDATLADPADDEVAAARSVLAAVGVPLLYARVDLVRVTDGTPHLMELELVEPQLFLRYAPHAAGRLADAVLRLAPADDDETASPDGEVVPFARESSGGP